MKKYLQDRLKGEAVLVTDGHHSYKYLDLYLMMFWWLEKQKDSSDTKPQAVFFACLIIEKKTCFLKGVMHDSGGLP